MLLSHINLRSCIHSSTNHSIAQGIMYFPTILLFNIIVLISQQTLAAIVTFADNQPRSLTTSQMHNIESFSNICCVLLDLDVKDGRGFGWYRAGKVSFNYVVAENAFTAVYPRGPGRLACSGQILDHQIGKRDWKTRFFDGGGVGSALVKEIWDERPIEYRWPTWVWVQGVEYEFFQRSDTGLFTYKDASGRFVFGRLFVEDGGLSTLLNSSRIEMPSQGSQVNVSSILAESK